MKKSRPPLRRTPAILLADGLVLLVLLCGALFSFISAFQIEAHTYPLLAACLITALVFLTVFSLPRGRHCLAALGVLLPLCGLAVWRLWPYLSLGEVSVRCTLVNRFAQDFSFLETIYPLAVRSRQEWLQAVTLYLGALAAALAFLLGWAVCRVRSVWLAFWLTFPILIPALCLTITPAWFPLILLIAGWCTLLLPSLAARQDRTGGAKLALITLPATGLLLLILTAALPQAQYQQPRWAVDALDRLLLWSGDLGAWFSGAGGFAGPKLLDFTAAGGSQSVDLSNAGPLHFNGRTMLRVQSEVRGKLYLRGHAAGTYTGSGWEPLAEDAYLPLFQAEGDDPLLGYQPLNFPSLTNPGSPYHPITVEVVNAPGGCVYTPYQLVTTPEQVRGAQFVYDSYLARDRSIQTHTVYYKPDGLLDGTFTPLTGQAAQAEQIYRNFARQNYSSISEADRETILGWLYRITHENPALFAVEPEDSNLPQPVRDLVFLVQFFQACLSSTTTYSQDTPRTPEEADFLDYFLNESKQGYCMHYATFSTLLFRMFGYPARYVSGYMTDIPTSGRVDVLDSAAHAWTEVYLDGYGWYPVDLTPIAGESGNPSPTPEATPAPSAQVAPTSTPGTSAPPAPSPTPQAGGLGQVDPSRLLWLIPLALLACIAGLPLRRALARRRRIRQFSNTDPNRAAIAAYQYLQALLPWGGVCPDHLQELAQKAAFSQHTLTPEELDAILSWVHTQAAEIDAKLPPPRRLLFRYGYGLY